VLDAQHAGIGVRPPPLILITVVPAGATIGWAGHTPRPFDSSNCIA